MKNLLIGGLVIGGAYFLLRDNIAQFFTGTATTPALPSPAATPATTPATTATTATQPAVVLAALSTRIGAALLNTSQTPDTWNWYLMQAYPAYVAPSPETLFPNKANAHDPVTLQTWFSALAPLLPSAGLSGVSGPRRAATAAPRRSSAARLAWS